MKPVQDAWWDKLVVSLSFADLTDGDTRDRLDNVAAKMNNQGVHLAAGWRYGRALPPLTAAIEIWGRLEAAGPLAGALNVRGSVWRKLGAYEAALADHEAALVQVENPVWQSLRVVALTQLGEDWLAAGEPSRAETALREALALSEDSRDAWGMGYVRRVWGLLAEAAKDWAGALAHYGAAVTYWRERAAAAAEIEATGGVIRALLAQGQVVAAYALAEQVLVHLAERGPAQLEEPLRLYWTLYRTLHMIQQPDDARAMLGAAHQMMTQQAEDLDPEVRHRFLTAVPVNRAISDAWIAAKDA